MSLGLLLTVAAQQTDTYNFTVSQEIFAKAWNNFAGGGGETVFWILITSPLWIIILAVGGIFLSKVMEERAERTEIRVPDRTPQVMRLTDEEVRIPSGLIPSFFKGGIQPVNSTETIMTDDNHIHFNEQARTLDKRQGLCL